MSITLKWRATLAVACMTLMAASFNARTQEVPLVTGEHWTKSTAEVKKAYLVGMANITFLELSYEGRNPASDAQSFLPRMVKGLKGQTLDSVRDALDKWYAAHPDQLQRPVIETIWFELVQPGLRNPK